MAAADDSTDRPQPTAHEPEPGCTLGRRDMMKTAAFTAAALAGASASSGSAAAADGIVQGIAEAVTGATLGVAMTTSPASLAMFSGALDVVELRDSNNTDPSADRLILHELVHNEIDWANAHYVNFGNYLTDTRPIASLEARHGIASTWEEGGSSADAHDRALQRIRQYYELLEFNNLHVGSKALLQLSYIHASGMECDNPYPVAGSAYIGGDTANEVQMRLTDTREEVSYTLHDGTAVDENAFDNVDHIEGAEGIPQMPLIEFRDFDTGDTLDTLPISQAVLDSYDPNNHPLHGQGQVTFTADDGTEYVTDLRFSVESVDDGTDDSENQSQRAFDGLEWLDLHDRVSQFSDQVVSRYDSAFVEDIYAELDAGNVTPEQVRSPEGMARFLAGTDDPTNDRYQIAWMQQFGFERADMKQVRGMTVNWSGATDTAVDADPNLDERYTYPDQFVTNETYSGVLFGTETSDGFQAGNEYLIGYPIYEATTSGVRAVDRGDDQPIWTSGTLDSPLIEVSDDGNTVYAAGTNTSQVVALNAKDGTEKWSTSISVPASDFELGPNGILYVGADYEEVVALDAEDGSQIAVNSTDPTNGPDGIAYYESRNVLFVKDGGASSIAALDGDDLSFVDDFTGNNAGGELNIVDGLLVSTQGYAYDPDDYTTIWNTSNPLGSAIKHPDQNVILTADSTSVAAIDPADGTAVWTTDHSASAATRITIPPSAHRIYAASGDGMTRVFDADDGTLIREFDSGAAAGIGMWYTTGYDGEAPRAIMFDEGDDGEGQMDLWFGTLEIVEMWDAGGNTLTHVTDQTISDIEALSGTPDSIDTVVSDMDQFDSIDDIRYQTHVLDILDYYGVDATVGEEDSDDVQITAPDYQNPGYDSYDASEFAEVMASLEEKIDQLEAEQEEETSSEEEDDGLGIGLPFDWGGGGGELLGLGLIAMVVLAVVGVVTDLIPGLGGN